MMQGTEKSFHKLKLDLEHKVAEMIDITKKKAEIKQGRKNNINKRKCYGKKSRIKIENQKEDSIVQIGGLKPISS